MKNLQALRANLTEKGFNILTDQAAFMVKGGGGKSRKKSGKKSGKKAKSNKGGGYGHGCYCGCGW